MGDGLRILENPLHVQVFINIEISRYLEDPSKQVTFVENIAHHKLRLLPPPSRLERVAFRQGFQINFGLASSLISGSRRIRGAETELTSAMSAHTKIISFIKSSHCILRCRT